MNEARIPIAEAALAFRTALEKGAVGPSDSAVLFHDVGRMLARGTDLAAAFPSQTLHALAIKANPLLGLLERAVAHGAGLEAASIEEVHLALAAGCPPEKVIFDSPARTLPELEFALSQGVYVNANSIEEVTRIASVKSRIDSTSTVGVRVNPLVGSGSIGATSVALHDSKFGVPVERRGALIELFAQYPWLSGLHYHVGSQGCGLELLLAAAREVQRLRVRIHEHVGRAQVTNVDIGGGLPTQYLSTDRVPNFGDYAGQLRREVPELFDDGTRLITEFGRSLQVPCGFTIARVESVKRTSDTKVLTMHVGSDLLLRPVYQPEHWRHEYALLDGRGNPKSGPESPWTLAGPMCFTDVVARDVELPAVSVGDYVLIRDTGAYTLGMWSRYCSRAMPAVIGYQNAADESSHFLLKRRETIEDVVDSWRA